MFVAEAGLRLIHPPTEFVTTDYYRTLHRLYEKNSEGVWAGNLGSVVEFKTSVKTNSLGLHDTDHPLQKDGRFRILCVGDSFVEAWQVPLEDTFFKRMEKKTGAEVIALGASGDGSFKEMQKLESVGFPFSPDLVMVFLTDQNDFKDDLFYLKRQSEKNPSKPVSPGLDMETMEKLKTYEKFLILKNSYLNRWIAFQAASMMDAKNLKEKNKSTFLSDMAVFLKPDSSLLPEQKQAWQNSVELTAMNHVRMKELCEAKGIRFLTVFIDDYFEYEPQRLRSLYEFVPEYRGELDFSGPRNRVKKILSANGVEYVDLNETFSTHFRKKERSYHYRFDPHWNKEGHMLAGDELAKIVKDKYL